MKVLAVFTYDYGVKAVDDTQQEMWFYSKEDLTPSGATYKGKGYSYDKVRWTKDKGGKVADGFTEWAEAMHRQTYDILNG